MALGQAITLKKKARIRVNNSCVLIGVIDERGILEENEIFLQIQRNSGVDHEAFGKRNNTYKTFLTDEKEVIGGKVIVTKNPCSHPGDIRLLNALSEDDERSNEFIHLCNVIVFSSKGSRPT